MASGAVGSGQARGEPDGRFGRADRFIRAHEHLGILRPTERVDFAARELGEPELEERTRASRVRALERGRKGWARRGFHGPGRWRLAAEPPARHPSIVRVRLRGGELLQQGRPRGVAGALERARSPVARGERVRVVPRRKRRECGGGAKPLAREIRHPSRSPATYAREGRVVAPCDAIVFSRRALPRAALLGDAAERISGFGRGRGAGRPLLCPLEEALCTRIVVGVPAPARREHECLGGHDGRCRLGDELARRLRGRTATERALRLRSDQQRAQSEAATACRDPIGCRQRPGRVALTQAQPRFLELLLGLAHEIGAVGEHPVGETPGASIRDAARMLLAKRPGEAHRGRLVAQSGTRLREHDHRPAPLRGGVVQMGQGIGEPPTGVREILLTACRKTRQQVDVTRPHRIRVLLRERGGRRAHGGRVAGCPRVAGLPEEHQITERFAIECGSRG